MDGKLHASACRFRTSGNSAFRERFSRHASARVDHISGIGTAELVDHPGHFPLAGAHIRSGHVEPWANQATLGEFLSEAPSNTFKLLRSPFARVDLECAFRGSEGNIDQRAFERHQGRKRLHLFGIGVAKRMPPLTGSQCSLWTDRQPRNTSAPAVLRQSASYKLSCTG